MQPERAPDPTAETDPGNVTVENFVQPSNAYEPTVAKVLSVMSMVFTEEPAKAYAFIEVTLDCRTTSDSLDAPEKA